MGKSADRAAAALVIRELGAEVVEWREDKPQSNFIRAGEVSGMRQGHNEPVPVADDTPSTDQPHLFGDADMQVLKSWKAPSARKEAEAKVKEERAMQKAREQVMGGREMGRQVARDDGKSGTVEVEL